MCTNGTACNPQTGLCEVLPCRNQCLATEHCEQTFTGDKCMPGAPTGPPCRPAQRRTSTVTGGKRMKMPSMAQAKFRCSITRPSAVTSVSSGRPSHGS